MGSSTWLTYADGTATTTTVTLALMNSGTQYEFQVTAVNMVGQGSPSTTEQAASLARIIPATAAVISPVMIDGVLVDISITPLTSSSGEPTTWAVKGPGFSMDFRPEPVGSNGTLSGPSQGLRTIPGSWFDVQGDGYKGASWVEAYLILKALVARTGLAPFITPRNASVIYLGEVEVLADGSFNIRVTIPETVDPSFNTQDHVHGSCFLLG